MAGAEGSSSSGDNPFSFKSFVNGKDTKVEKDIFSDDEEDDIFAEKPTKASISSKKPKSSKNVVEVEAVKGGETEAGAQRDKENPFSFKKFLSASSSSASTSSSKTKPKKPSDVHPLPPDIASDIPLFANNHFNKVEKSALPKRNQLNPTFSNSLDDEDNLSRQNLNTLSSSNKSNHSGILSSKNLPSNSNFGTDQNNPSLFNDDDDDCDDFENETSVSPEPVSGGVPVSDGLQLPDFLSDGPLLGEKRASTSTRSNEVEIGRREDDLLHQISKLQEKNNQLREDLTRMKQKCDNKNQRITQLKTDLERQKKKESEETAVMEKAVLQVEENLVTTTQRAVQAESTVTKLKQEVKSLQGQVRSLSAENEAYRSGDGGLSDIRERTKYSSEQLKTAADMAEKNLKDLLSGVDKMKLLSQVLASWEKVTEVKPESGTEGSESGNKKS